MYLILPEVSSGAGILLLSGVFVAQIAMDVYNTPIPYFGPCRQKCSCLKGQQKQYRRINSDPEISPVTVHQSHSMCSKAGVIIENKIVKVFALLLQLAGIIGFSALWSKLSMDTRYKSLRPIIGYPIVIIVLSIIWTNLFQEYIAQPRKSEEDLVQDSEAKTRCTTVGENTDDDTKQCQSEAGQQFESSYSSQEYEFEAGDNIVTARFKSSGYNNMNLANINLYLLNEYHRHKFLGTSRILALHIILKNTYLLPG